MYEGKNLESYAFIKIILFFEASEQKVIWSLFEK